MSAPSTEVRTLPLRKMREFADIHGGTRFALGEVHGAFIVSTASVLRSFALVVSVQRALNRVRAGADRYSVVRVPFACAGAQCERRDGQRSSSAERATATRSCDRPVSGRGSAERDERESSASGSPNRTSTVSGTGRACERRTPAATLQACTRGILPAHYQRPELLNAPRSRPVAGVRVDH